MAPKDGGKDGGLGGIRRSGDDAVKLTIDYLKQETLGPLKGLGRFLMWGLAGSVAIAIGVLLVLVGVLRLLQDQTGTALTGDWSWVPYFAVAVLGLAVAGLAAWRITKGPAEPKLPKTRALHEAEHAKAAAVPLESASPGAMVPPPPLPPMTAPTITTETREGNI